MLLKLPASSGKTGAMRAGITGTDSTYEQGQIGEQVRGFDISGGYETVKCHWACHFPNFRLFVGGKGSRCEKKKGSLCEEES